MHRFGRSADASSSESTLHSQLITQQDAREEEEQLLQRQLEHLHRPKSSMSSKQMETQSTTSVSPLTSHTHQFKRAATSSADKDKGKAVDVEAGRIYASNAPKILLETITARTALLVIALTYIIFFIGFSLDFRTIYRSFNSRDYELGAFSCSSYNSSSVQSLQALGCSAGNAWNSTVTELQNVISIKLSVQQNNVTLLWPNATTVPAVLTFAYDINIWACYNENGCGKHYSADGEYTQDPNVWQRVLQLDNQQARIDTKVSMAFSPANEYYINYELLANTFQNQEAIPTNGLVRAYHMEIVYYDNDEYGLFSGANTALQKYITYTFDVATRSNQPIVDALTIILMFCTLCLLLGYISVVSKQPYWLSEQKWLVMYFVLVIFFQNPIYVCIDWYQHAPPASVAYASYVMNYAAQSGLFTLWLLFADSINRKSSNAYYFYLPKVFCGLVIFIVGIVILTIQFPGLTPTATERHTRNAVEAVVNWKRSLRLEFIAFTFVYMLLIMLWAVVWIVRLFLTGRELKRIPYMSTRYIQLSYRFFFIQATLVTFYYVFQYAAVAYFIAQGSGNAQFNTTTITDGINTLFRQQTQLFGKTLFLTVYAAILAFLFLPASFWETSKNNSLAALAATFVITEDEHGAVVKKRKSALYALKKNLINQVARLDQLVDAKVDVFCVDTALTMRAVSFNAYYDPPHLSTLSSFGNEMDLDAVGFTLIDCYYDRGHEVFCFVAREKATNRLVVSFRGTASKRQMEDNLNYTKKPVNFHDMSIPTLDHIDGLNIKPLSADEDFELESVSDTEEDLLIDDDIESDSVGSGMLGRVVRDRDNNDVSADNRETFIQRAGQVTDNFTRAFGDAMDATNQGINKVVGATTSGLVVTAASISPALKSILLPHVHSGFWDAYLVVRGFVHAILRQELIKHPSTVFFTGHSLGGALATFAALDVSLHTIPRVNAYLKHQAKLKLVFERTNSKKEHAAETSRRGILQWLPSLRMGLTADGASSSELPKISAEDKVFVKKIKASLYSFGCPRVGNHSFAQLYDRTVPSTFRVVVDGDIVVGLPPGYTHVGTEILVDSIGSGSIIIDPSFVERWLRTHLKSSVAAHSLLVYRKSLLGVKLAAEFMKQCATDSSFQNIDPLRVAMRIRNNAAFEKLLDQQAVTTVLKSQPVDLSQRISVTSETTNLPFVSQDDVSLQEMSPKESQNNTDDASLTPYLSHHSPEDILAIETKHYEKDKEQMEEFVKQMRPSKSVRPIGWIKDHTVGKLSRKFKHSDDADEEEEVDGHEA